MPAPDTLGVPTPFLNHFNGFLQSLQSCFFLLGFGNPAAVLLAVGVTQYFENRKQPFFRDQLLKLSRHVPRRTTQPDNENEHEALHWFDERFQRENSESRGYGSDPRRTLQFRQSPQDAENHAEYGCWP